MKEYKLNIVGHSADLKTTPTGSKDTGIFFPQDLIDFLGPEKDYSFTIYKEDCIRALVSIISSLPLYSNKGGKQITHLDITDECLRLFTMIQNYFGNSKTATYSGFALTETTGGRRYLYGLEQKGFSVRKLLIANHSIITFQKDIAGNILLRFQTDLAKDQVQNKNDGNSNIIKESKKDNLYRPFITAIKSKPFLLLAGISGTGKSRIVRELARACWDEGSEEYKATKPRNFEMVQVKPNWHDSSELIGYVSRVSGEAEFIAGDFLRFVVRAWDEENVPYFLCLDEMNLAPVEQYFAEYLSVIETRKNKEGTIVTDPILKPALEKNKLGELQPKKWYAELIKDLLSDCSPEKEFGLKTQFETEGIALPKNLIVVGTVNMDETTFSFSRKVLDRAMTIEMNEVKLDGGLTERNEKIGKLGNAELIGTAVEGVDVYSSYQGVCDEVIHYLEEINNKLENTPFKIAYRTRNEALLYVVNNLPYNKDEDGKVLDEKCVVARALDEITSMKILSRIEGDETKIGSLLDTLKTAISVQLKEVSGKDYSPKKDETEKVYSPSLAKLEEMISRLESGYTSFWS